MAETVTASPEQKIAVVETRPPKRRIMELDLARSIAILGLPLVHMMEEFEECGFLSNPALEAGALSTNWYEIVLRFFTSSFAPMFMILMGVNMTLSSHATAEKLLKRGIRIVIYFFILNILRYVIPDVISYFMGYGGGLHDSIVDFLASDILFLAGTSMILIALFKKRDNSPAITLILALFMLAVSMLIPENLIKNEYLKTFLGNFFRIDGTSYFPLLSWFAYPALGYALGKTIKDFEKDLDRKKRIYLHVVPSALILLACLYICLSKYGISPFKIVDDQSNIYLNDFWCYLSAVLWTCVWFSGAYFICKAIKSQWVKNAIYKISDSIMIFYCIQWILVGWITSMLLGAGLEDSHFMGDVPFYIASFAVWGITIGLALWINAKLRKKGIRL